MNQFSAITTNVDSPFWTAAFKKIDTMKDLDEKELERFNSFRVEIEMYFAKYMISLETSVEKTDPLERAANMANILAVTAIRDLLQKQLVCTLHDVQNDPFFGRRAMPVLLPVNDVNSLDTISTTYWEYLSRMEEFYPGAVQNYSDYRELFITLFVVVESKPEKENTGMHYLIMPEAVAFQRCVKRNEQRRQANQY